MGDKHKIVLGIGGASGAIYAKQLLDILDAKQNVELGVVMSENALINWKLENGEFQKDKYQSKFYTSRDFNAPFASGSAKYSTMIVCPCSMGLLARIATGVSNDLMTRAADVILKERRRLIVVPREAPYSLIHIKNMLALTEAGGIVCPATPSFYSNPQSVEEIVNTVVHRVLDLAQIDIDTYRWSGA